MRMYRKESPELLRPIEMRGKIIFLGHTIIPRKSGE